MTTTRETHGTTPRSDPPGRRRRTAVLLTVLVAAVPAVWALWTQSAVGSAVCRADWFPDRAHVLCADADRAVSTQDASQYAFDYLDELTDGDGPDGAWEMLSSDYEDKLDRPDYDADAATLLWAEPVDAAEDAPGFNKFDVVWRYYVHRDGRVKPHITTVRYTISLQRTGDDIVMTGRKNRGKAANTRYLDFPTVFLMRAVDTYQLPRSTSEVALHTDPAGRSGDLDKGGRLSAMCNLKVTGTAGVGRVPGDDRGWWTRTPQGWLPSGVLAEDRDRPLTDDKISGVPDCDAGVLSR